MSKKSLPFFVPLAVLLFASLACNAITGGAGPGSGVQATANAAFTQAASGAATAGAVGSSAGATANAAATQLVATANAASGGNTTSSAPTATKEAAGEATAAATEPSSGGGGAISGGPKDIPVVSGDNTVLLASDKVVSYESKSDFATVVQFYKDEMPKNGWTLNTATSVETANATVLAYSKDTRQAQVSITTDPSSKATVVLITLQ